MSFQSTVTNAVTEKGYIITPGEDLAGVVKLGEPAWEEFTAFWDDLGEDRYLKGDYMWRYRRYGQLGFVPETGRIWLREHIPYFQSSDINSYVGGIAREFAPLTDELVTNEIFQDLVRGTFDMAAFDDEYRDAEWTVEVSVFRVRVEGARVVEPTPEGIHRDGVPFGVIHLINRVGIEGAVSHVYSLDEELLDVGVLKEPMDSLYAWDNRVLHYATPLYASTMQEGHRDVLIYGYHLDGTKYEKG